MNHHAPLLIVVGMLALASASLAAVCGDPDAIATPVPEVTATVGIEATPSAIPADTATPGAPTPTAPPDTPVPTASLEEEPTSAPNRISHLPTPSSLSDAMLLGGHIYVDGRPREGAIRAFIGTQECGQSGGVGVSDDAAMFVIAIESDAHQPGCGTVGALITFTIGSSPVDQSVAWQPGYHEQSVTLSAGLPMAVYSGSLTVGDADMSLARVVPYVGDTVCGDEIRGVINPQDHARWVFRLIVDPDDIRPGCGRDDADVTLRLETDGRPAIVIAVVPWQPLPPVELSNIDVRSQLEAWGTAQ